jgi:uncharacterized membrane protein
MMVVSDLAIIFQVYLITLGLSMLAWPILIRLRMTLIDGGWAVGRLTVTLIVSLMIWFLAHCKIPINTDWGVFFVLMILVLGCVWQLIRRNKGEVFDWFKRCGRLVLVEEGLFLFGFVFLALVRGFNPEILDLEKFMDWGFIKSYLVSSTLPASDMWWAGESINYYSFGHFWASIMVRIFGMGDGYGFNLMLAFICGLTLSLGFSVIVNLLYLTGFKKSLIFGGITGALLLTFGGNSQMWWFILKNRTLEGYWYPDATRFIYHTIHEFPGYSFVVSDLHGHLLGLPVVLLFLLALIVWMKKMDRKTSIIIGVLLGLMMMTNTWDLLIYGLLLGIVFLFKLRSEGKKLIKLGLFMAIGAVLTSWWWWLGFKNISGGVGLVGERSPWWQLLALWGGHLLFTFGALVFVFKNKKRTLPVAMILTALILLILPEIIYVRDIYTTYPRANTMFKLTYQSFVIMSILAGWLLGRLGQFRSWSRLILIPGVLLWAGLMIYPIPAFPSYYGNFQKYKGLDGRAWIGQELPEQMEMINYLESNRDGRNMVEAVGESYTKFNAISAFSGVPTVLGWKVHEWLWRGGYDAVGKRADEVAKIYPAKDIEEVKGLINQYNVGWIVVGENERNSYQVNEELLLDLGEKVVETNGGYLIWVR